MASRPEQPKKQRKSETLTITCRGCGKIGVSICAKCAKSKGRILAARACPLKERDPELYNRLDDLSQRPLEGNKQLWDEFCVEIGAQQYYEHLPVLKEVIDEGLWRTDAQYPLRWVRENLARRVKRFKGLEDYDRSGKRRSSGPKFDGRNGALIKYVTRPFAEFEVTNSDGETISPEEVIDGRLARKSLCTAGDDEDSFVMPADENSLRSLSKKTLTEWVESDKCKSTYLLLQHDRPLFDQMLARATFEQRALAERVGLDQDEAEVLAVITLLWAVGPCTYLNFLEGTNKRRIRNAWDRFGRRLKKLEWSRFLRKTLQEEGRKERGRREARWFKWFWEGYEFKEPDPESLPRRTWDSSRGAGIPVEESLRQHTQMDEVQGLLFPPSNEPGPELEGEDGARTVDLSCDLTPKQRVLYRSSARKPMPRRKTKLYSE